MKKKDKHSEKCLFLDQVVALGWEHIQALKRNVFRRKYGSAAAIRMNHLKQRPNFLRNRVYMEMPVDGIVPNQYAKHCLLLLIIFGYYHAR